MIALIVLALCAFVFFVLILPNRSGGDPVSPPVIAEPPAAELPAETVDIETVPGYTEKPIFLSNLDSYESYMNPDGDEYLTLINYENLLDETYKPDDLTDLIDTRKDGRNTQQMRLYAAKSLEALLIEARACGIDDVSVTSAYRSYAYQKQLFDQRVQQYIHLGEEEAYRKASTINAVPGTSEHQSGLCCDMHNIAAADVSFAKTEAAEWLKNNCHHFGFILRYPEDKTEITKISFEPWHFRYVGRKHATKMHELGMCLEEYIDYRKGA